VGDPGCEPADDAAEMRRVGDIAGEIGAAEHDVPPHAVAVRRFDRGG
jgi:hypothetical protein